MDGGRSADHSPQQKDSHFPVAEVSEVLSDQHEYTQIQQERSLREE
jgi:hypothetical protein